MNCIPVHLLVVQQSISMDARTLENTQHQNTVAFVIREVSRDTKAVEPIGGPPVLS